MEDLEAPRRQTSMDGEAIKIVIHDVDSGPICASKRRVVLRRDPTDKAHRSEYTHACSFQFPDNMHLRSDRFICLTVFDKFCVLLKFLEVSYLYFDWLRKCYFYRHKTSILMPKHTMEGFQNNVNQ